MLTKDDIKAIRKCDRVVCYALEESGLAYLKLIKEVKVQGFVTEETVEAKHEIEMPGHFKIYDDTKDYTHKAFFWIPYADSTGTWQALRYILKEGDQLTANISVGDNGKSSQDVGIHDDCFQITVKRKDEMVIREFVLVHSVCANNSARAVQRVSRKLEQAA